MKMFCPAKKAGVQWHALTLPEVIHMHTSLVCPLGFLYEIPHQIPDENSSLNTEPKLNTFWPNSSLLSYAVHYFAHACNCPHRLHCRRTDVMPTSTSLTWLTRGWDSWWSSWQTQKYCEDGSFVSWTRLDGNWFGSTLEKEGTHVTPDRDFCYIFICITLF